MNKRFEVSSKGHLLLGGCDAVELTKTYGTPLYVMDEQKVRDAMRAYRTSMEKYYGGNGLICYASKAFACKEMYRIANEEGLGVDVVSGGELYTALSTGFPAEKIGFHGNNKLPAEIRMALENGVGRMIVDGLGELELVDRIAGELGVKANIILRITPGVDAHTHDFIRTGQIDSKFGLALETGAAMEGVKAALKAENICLKGLDCHIGSQIMDVEPFVHTGEIMMQFILDIKNETGVEMEELDLGGGFGIRYVGSDDPVPYDSYMEAVSEGIKAFAEKHGLKTPFIFMEPGRSIVGEAGTTLYTVGAIKEIPGIRTYVSIDGGMSDNPRYALYQAKYDFLLAEKADAPADSVVTVAGKCCESGDLLGEHVKMPMPKTGDILAVLSTGAYNYSKASNYNRNPIPPVVMVKDGASRVIVKGQTYEDMARFDV